MKVPIPFAVVPSNRDYTRDKDSLLLNCFIERQGEKLTVIKRPGFNLVKDVSGTITSSYATRGAIWCAAHSKYYVVAANKIYSISSDFVTITDITAANTINTTTGKVYLDIYYDSVAVVVITIPSIGATASQLYKITDATPSVATEITVNFPDNVAGSGIVFNNYYFVVNNIDTTLSRRIYNCALNDIDTWSTTNYIVAEEYPDAAVSLVKINNQLACLKENTIEFFYDAANPTGSPLSKTVNATLNIGCGSAESVLVEDNVMLWLSRDHDAGLGVHMFANGQLQKISTPFIDKILAATEAIILQHKVESFLLSYNGHKFYGLTIQGDSASTTTAIPDIALPDIAIPDDVTSSSVFQRTLVYDLTENLWQEWSTNNGSDSQVSIMYSHVIPGAPSSTIDYTNTLALGRTGANFYSMSPEPIGTTVAPTHKDYNKLIRTEIVTNIFDGEIQDKKRCNSLEILGDRTLGSSISVYYSDDDYTTWSNARTVTMSSRPRIRNLGSFEQRAFKFVHEVDTDMRLRGFELDIEKGSH